MAARKKTLGILISGRGSNMTALVEACAATDFPARVALVISNRPDAAGLEYAARAGIETLVVDHKGFTDRATFEGALDAALRRAKVDIVCLAGFMRLLTADFVKAWNNRMVNIHPSLLPAFKGLHVHERVLETGTRITGCSVHFVRPEMDTGPVIVQAAVPVAPDDTPDTLGARVLKAEHVAYPTAVRLVASGKARVVGERVVLASGSFADGALFNPF